MFRVITWLRVLTAAVLLALFAPAAAATSGSIATEARSHPTARTQTTESEGADAVRPPAGSPEFGVVIIVGIVGVLIFFAWVFSRAGGRQSDGVTD